MSVTCCVQIMDEATDSVTCLDVSDHEILTGSADGQVRLYDLRLGRLLTDYLGSEYLLEPLAIIFLLFFGPYFCV